MSEKPIRVAVLGGSSTGKTALVSRLTVDIVHEVHYPTRKQTNWLFTFKPSSPLARFLLDRKCHARVKLRTRKNIDRPLSESPEITPNVLLSPFIYQCITKEYKGVRDSKVKEDGVIKRDNNIYEYLDSHDELNERNTNSMTNNDGNIVSQTRRKSSLSVEEQEKHNLTAFRAVGYVPPSYTEIPIDIIDTPGFNPDMVVPFLELSLFSNLGKSILRGLADEPRRPVSTQPLLVASGTAELNGRVNGYFLVYSLVPELNKIDAPPSYDDAPKDLIEDTDDLLTCGSNTSRGKSTWNDFSDGGFNLLTTIRNCVLDGWKEFRNYQKITKNSGERDIYNLMDSLKTMWKTELHSKEKEKQKLMETLSEMNLEPDHPDSPPPVIIIGTHLCHELSSPVLLQWGKNLALNWNCGFVALDSITDDNVDVALAMLIREIIEKDDAICKKQMKKSSLGKFKR